MKMIICVRIFFLIILIVNSLSGQIELKNNSFEEFDTNKNSYPLKLNDWLKIESNSTPDILPGAWGIFTEAFDGEKFVGLILREDGTSESLCQQLRTPLLKDNCYQFKMAIMKSNTYVGYNEIKCKILVIGANSVDDFEFVEKRGKCNYEIMAETKPIDNGSSWKESELMFTPKQNYKYLILKIVSAEKKGKKTNFKGNAFIDKISTIEKCEGE